MSLTENIVVLLRFQWDLQVPKAPWTFYRKDKTFAVCLDDNNSTSSRPRLILLTNLNVLGLKALNVEVTCTSQMKLEMTEQLVKIPTTDLNGDCLIGGLHELFVLNDIFIDSLPETHLLQFCIRVTSCVDNP